MGTDDRLREPRRELRDGVGWGRDHVGDRERQRPDRGNSSVEKRRPPEGGSDRRSRMAESSVMRLL